MQLLLTKSRSKGNRMNTNMVWNVCVLELLSIFEWSAAKQEKELQWGI
jgi:hypothetical protein